jgi:hypothetical protein
MRATTLWAVALLGLCVDGVVWGLAAHALCRWLGLPARRTQLPALAAGLLFVAWDRWLFAALVGWVSLAGRPAAGAEWLVEVGVQVGATWVGFQLGRRLIDGILLRSGPAREPPAPGEPVRGR